MGPPRRPVRDPAGGVRIYAATGGHDAPADFWPNKLISYLYDRGLRVVTPQTERVIVDSGAFTAWNLGRHIELDGYLEWALSVVGRAPSMLFVNLDVIPGTPGERVAPAAAAAAAEASERNADTIRAAGLPLMEVWHRGEPLDHLDVLIARRAGMPVGIGGLVGSRTDVVVATCDRVFHHVLDRYSLGALPPLHGLGVGAFVTMRRYPWWSVDSTTWKVPSRYGKRINLRGTQEDGPAAEDRRYVRIEMGRILRRWRYLERELTRTWEARGVRYDAAPT